MYRLQQFFKYIFVAIVFVIVGWNKEARVKNQNFTFHNLDLFHVHKPIGIHDERNTYR